MCAWNCACVHMYANTDECKTTPACRYNTYYVLCTRYSSLWLYYTYMHIHYNMCYNLHSYPKKWPGYSWAAWTLPTAMQCSYRVQQYLQVRFLRLEGKTQNWVLIIQFSYVNNCLGPKLMSKNAKFSTCTLKSIITKKRKYLFT